MTKLFTEENTIENSRYNDYENKVLIIKPEWLKEAYRTPENQLFLAKSGFGCDPSKVGTAVYGVFLIDGESLNMRRGDFLGIIKDENLPEWAREKLKSLEN